MIPDLSVPIHPLSWASCTGAPEFHRHPPGFNSCSLKYPAEGRVKPFLCTVQITWFIYSQPSVGFSSTIRRSSHFLPCSVYPRYGSTPLNPCRPSPCSFLCIHTVWLSSSTHSLFPSKLFLLLVSQWNACPFDICVPALFLVRSEFKSHRLQCPSSGTCPHHKNKTKQKNLLSHYL